MAIISIIRIFQDKMFGIISKILHRDKTVANPKDEIMKYLIVGLGNIGDEYTNTRHNIGFAIIDTLASLLNCKLEDKRYGHVGKCRIKNAELVLLKPSTYMNLSGNSIRYWLQKEKIPVERMLVICDDISLPLGKLRLRTSGSDGGHNGLKHIISVLGNTTFNRMRFGIGNNYPHGGQVDYVLGKFTDEEISEMESSIHRSTDAIKTFCLTGITSAMNEYNRQ